MGYTLIQIWSFSLQELFTTYVPDLVLRDVPLP